MGFGNGMFDLNNDGHLGGGEQFLRNGYMSGSNGSDSGSGSSSSSGSPSGSSGFSTRHYGGSSYGEERRKKQQEELQRRIQEAENRTINERITNVLVLVWIVVIIICVDLILKEHIWASIIVYFVGTFGPVGIAQKFYRK